MSTEHQQYSTANQEDIISEHKTTGSPFVLRLLRVMWPSAARHSCECNRPAERQRLLAEKFRLRAGAYDEDGSRAASTGQHPQKAASILQTRKRRRRTISLRKRWPE